jgi:hypothetical protein
MYVPTLCTCNWQICALDTTHNKLLDCNITFLLGHNKTLCSNCLSSIIDETWILLCSSLLSVIGMFKSFNTCLCLATNFVVANKSIEALNVCYSSYYRKKFVLSIRYFQSSNIGSTFFML